MLIGALRQLIVLGSLVLMFPACAKIPYRYGPAEEQASVLQPAADEKQITCGEPYTVIDFIGRYQPFALLSKLILWNWSIENHEITPETEQALADYCTKNHLNVVKVRLNEYSPGGEFRRLLDNSNVGAGWRYTIGMLSVFFYTVLPGRIFGGDNYNPYTNTISLYSDHRAVALHEGGHAKYFASLKYKGTSAFLYMLPLASLYFEAEATGDAIGYAKAECDAGLEERSYKVLYPAYGTYLGGGLVEMTSFWSNINELLMLAAVIPGHAVGRIKAAHVENACPAEPVASAALLQ